MAPATKPRARPVAFASFIACCALFTCCSDAPPVFADNLASDANASVAVDAAVADAAVVDAEVVADAFTFSS